MQYNVMVFERVKPHIVLKPEEKEALEKIVNSRKSSITESERAKIILMDADGKGVNAIARTLETNRTKTYLTEVIFFRASLSYMLRE